MSFHLRAQDARRQTKLDEKKGKDSSEQDDSVDNRAEEQATTGSKRKETDSAADEKQSQDDNNDRVKSRKTEKNDEQEAKEKDDSSEKRRTGDGELAEPVKLSGEQRKVDSQLKGDDVEINKGDYGSSEKKSSGSSSEVPWHVSEKGL